MRECAGSIPYSPVRVAAGACVVVIWMSSSVVVDLSTMLDSAPLTCHLFPGGGKNILGEGEEPLSGSRGCETSLELRPAQPTARPFAVSLTSMFPRVALEYGQTR